jgi:signal peptidase I
VARVVATTLLAIALVVACATAYGLADNRWYKIIAVDGNSMAPTFHIGDALVITRPPHVLTPGMIVTLEVDHEVVTHRYVGMKNGVIVTKGDANNGTDDWSHNHVRVVGVVRLVLPHFGRLLTSVTSAAGSHAWFAFADTSPSHTAQADWDAAPPVPTVPPECTAAGLGSFDAAHTIIGTPGNDTLVGGNGNTLIFGLGGDDTVLAGKNSKDCLVGGSGNDTLVGGNAGDVLLGDSGSDTLQGKNGSDRLYGGSGADNIDGGPGPDVCYPGGDTGDVVSGCESIRSE